MDCRVKPGNDGGCISANGRWYKATGTVGALGQPQQADLEVLWLICDLQESGEISFSEALRELEEFVHEFDEALCGFDAPRIHHPAARAIVAGILAQTDRTTVPKRLRRLALRYPTHNALFLTLNPERASSNAFGLPDDALCSGPSWEI